MHKNINIPDKYSDNNAGMTVPPGFFDEFKARMSSSLPEQPWEARSESQGILPRTKWQKIRPYVYMAAMFMGIWCMMKMFDLMHPADHTNISANPVLMSAIDNDTFYYDYCVTDVSESDIYDDLYSQGLDPDDLSFPVEQ